MTAVYGVLSNTTYTGRVNTTITAPASIGNGDLLFLAHITVNPSGAAVTQTLPAGFSAIGTRQTGTEGSVGYGVIMGYRIAASESGDYTVTHASSNSQGLVLRIDGTATLSVDVSSQNSGVAGVGVVTTALSVTPTATDDLLLLVGLNWNAGALTPPTGMTERLDATLLYFASEALASGSATGDRVYNQSAGTPPWFANLVAIKDATLAALAVTGAQTTGATTQTGGATIGYVRFDLTADPLDSRITFSRASLGTYYGADGLLKYAAHNLILQSQDFNTTWTKSGGATVTVDAIAAPDSTTTADKFNHVTAGTVTSGQVAATPGYTHAAVVSVYAKAGTKNWLVISCLANTSAIYHCYFNLSSGVVGAVGSQWTSSGIQSMGSGWYRCWALTKAGIGGSGCILYMAEASGSVQMTSPGDIYIWGAQAEQVTTATTPGAYLPTTTAAVHGPRLDYDPVTHVARGLLIEESRGNLSGNTQDFTVGAWTKTGVTITADQTTAPDGTTTADLMTASASPATITQVQGVAAASPYVQSVFVKKGTSDWIYMTGESTDLAKAWFNIATGTVGTKEAGLTSSAIQNVGNNWYRCSIIDVGGAGTESIQVGLCDADTSTTVTVGRTVYLWGAQTELGTFLTSYFPTNTTRAADVAVMTGTNFSSWYNQAQGTFVAGFELMAQTGTRPVLSVDNAAVAERILLYGSGTDPKVTITDNSVTQADLDLGTL